MFFVIFTVVRVVRVGSAEHRLRDDRLRGVQLHLRHLRRLAGEGDGSRARDWCCRRSARGRLDNSAVLAASRGRQSSLLRHVWALGRL